MRKAAQEEAGAISLFRAEVAADVTSRFGNGMWSNPGTERGVLSDMRNSALYVSLWRDKVDQETGRALFKGAPFIYFEKMI